VTIQFAGRKICTWKSSKH